MTSSTDKPETWFTTTIAKGLRSFLPLALDGQPATELLGVTVQTWAEDLWPYRKWDSQRDLMRMEEAFSLLRRNSTRWPQMIQWAEAFADLNAPPPAPAAPYHAPAQISWDKSTPRNQSPIAKAHCRFNSLRLGIPVPAWTALDTPEAEGIYAQLCADYGDPIGAKAAPVARNPAPDARMGSTDAVLPEAGPASNLGCDVERGVSERETVADDEYGEHLGRRYSGADSWEIYREAS